MFQRAQGNIVKKMVESFESQLECGLIGYWEGEDFETIIGHYEETYKYHEAIKVADVALERYPYRFTFLLAKARLLGIISQPDRALHVLEQAEKLAPSEPEIRLLRGDILLMTGEFKKALSEYEGLKGEVFGEGLCHVLIRESYIHESMKDFDSMFYTLKQALEIDPDNSEALEQIWMSNFVHSEERHS